MERHELKSEAGFLHIEGPTVRGMQIYFATVDKNAQVRLGAEARSV